MYRSLKYAGLDPGAEFKAAMLEAHAINARYGNSVSPVARRVAEMIGAVHMVQVISMMLKCHL